MIAFVMAFVSVPVAYANADGGGDTTTPPVTTTEPEDMPEPVVPATLTPDGQLTLVDDITGNQADDKQVLTIITKNGNYFYLIIDRARDTENVYFLNLVDESDLLAVIEGKPATTPVVTNPEPVEPTPVKVEPTPEPENNMSAILSLILVLALTGGGVFFYIKVLKPKRSSVKAGSAGNIDLDEFDFDDDFDDRGGDDIDIMEPDSQTEPYSYEDYEAKEDEE
jgi:hypothetical protein